MKLGGSTERTTNTELITVYISERIIILFRFLGDL